jgi:hypothetical protein
MTTFSKEKLSQAAQEMTLPQSRQAASVADTSIKQVAVVEKMDEVDGASAAVDVAEPHPEPRIRVMRLVWKRRAMSVKGDLEAETPIGRIVITMALLPSKTPCTLQMPPMGEHSFRPIPCETVEEAQRLASSEIEALVRSLTVTEIEPASPHAA